MEKIILRKDIVSFMSSSLFELTGGKRYSNEKKMIKHFGLKNVMKKLFNEDIESQNLFDSHLYQLYTEILANEQDDDKCYKENDKFIELYRIDEDFALQLDFNIHLYHLIPKKDFYMQIVPWYYADSKKYVGDTWGEQDDEIIENIQCLSIINFMKRYKGY